MSTVVRRCLVEVPSLSAIADYRDVGECVGEVLTSELQFGGSLGDHLHLRLGMICSRCHCEWTEDYQDGDAHARLVALGVVSESKEERKVSEVQSESKSSVAVEANSKGDAQPKVKTYDGVTEEEMARLAKIAVDTFVDVRRQLAEAGVSLP